MGDSIKQKEAWTVRSTAKSTEERRQRQEGAVDATIHSEIYNKK